MNVIPTQLPGVLVIDRPQPDSAAMMCSMVETETPSAFSITVQSRDGVTLSQRASIRPSRSAMSVRRNQIP